MTTSVLRPNAIVIDDALWVRTGGATKHGVLADDSDATYIQTDTAGASMRFGFTTATMAAGSVSRTVQFAWRGRLAVENGASIQYPTWTLRSGGVILDTGTFPIRDDVETTYNAPVEAMSLTQAQIDGFEVTISIDGSNGNTLESFVRANELYLALVHTTLPVTNITYPTGSPTITTTNRPTFTWTYTPGNDGGPQAFYQIKVFTAAQYGAGGFSPDTSTPYWSSGYVVGAADSHLSGPLTTGTMYRVYIQTAQHINYAGHWSAWDNETFTISVTTSDVEDVTPTVDNTNGRILVAVDRVAASAAWDFIEAQRSTDAGTTWEYLRGGEYVPPATTTLWSTGDASNFDIYDYETPNGTSVRYRARATRILSTLPITGEWIQSAALVSWTSTLTFIKAPNTPALNAAFNVENIPTMTRSIRQGVHQVLARREPVVIGDVRGSVSGQVDVITLDDDEADDLLALVELASPLLIQAPPPARFGSRYVAVAEVVEARGSRYYAEPLNVWSMPFVEVVAPSDPEAGAPDG